MATKYIRVFHTLRSPLRISSTDRFNFNNDINKLPELRKNAKDWTKSYSSNNLCRRVEKIYQKIVA